MALFNGVNTTCVLSLKTVEIALRFDWKLKDDFTLNSRLQVSTDRVFNEDSGGDLIDIRYHSNLLSHRNSENFPYAVDYCGFDDLKTGRQDRWWSILTGYFSLVSSGVLNNFRIILSCLQVL